MNIVNDAQKLREKKTLDDVLSGLRDQHAFFDLDQPQRSQEITDSTNTLLNDVPLKSYLSHRISTSDRYIQQSSSARRSVSFADKVNVLNDDDETDMNRTATSPLAPISNEQNSEENLTSSAFINSSYSIKSNQDLGEEKYTDSDYYSLSSSSSFQYPQYDTSALIKYNLPSKYRLSLASEVLVNKMDSNLRMLIIKELSKSGRTERPLSKMSKSFENINVFSFLFEYAHFRFSLWH